MNKTAKFADYFREDEPLKIRAMQAMVKVLHQTEKMLEGLRYSLNRQIYRDGMPPEARKRNKEFTKALMDLQNDG